MNKAIGKQKFSMIGYTKKTHRAARNWYNWYTFLRYILQIGDKESKGGYVFSIFNAHTSKSKVYYIGYFPLCKINEIEDNAISHKLF